MTDTLDELTSGVRFGKFASVGLVGATFDLSVSTVLIVFAGVVGEVAKLAGAEVAIVVMFAINEHWTFADAGAAGRAALLTRFLKSNLVRSGGIVIQVLVVWAFGHTDLSFVFAGVDLWRLIPLPLAIGASMFLNYLGESLLTWRVGRS